MIKLQAGATQFANKIASGDYRAIKLLIDLRDVLANVAPTSSFGEPPINPLERIQKRLEEIREKQKAFSGEARSESP